MEQILLNTLKVNSISVNIFDSIPIWMWAVGIALVVMLSIIPAAIASDKGYNGFAYYLFGLIALPFAITTVCLIPNRKRKMDVTDDTYMVWAMLASIETKLKRIEAQLNEKNSKKE